MSSLLLGTIVFIALTAAASIASAAEFYVSKEGFDTWTGTLDKPNAQKSDGPFATLTRARDAVRALKKDKPVTVQIREGSYPLTETVVFGLEDSGTEDGRITYEAYPNETPVFSAAIDMGGWEKVATALPHLPEKAKGKVWVTNIPEIDGAPRKFLTLYDGGGLLPRARSAGFIPAGPKSGKTSVTCPPGFVRNWSNLDDVELVTRPLHAWIVNILPLAAVDVKKRSLTTSIPASYTIKELHYLPGTLSCWIENVIDALDEPGEWVIDTKAGKIYLWARDGAEPKHIKAPLLRELIRVEGEVDLEGATDTPVKYVSFKGLSFTHGERFTIAKDDKGLQHDWEMQDNDNALVRLRGAEHCKIERCHFSHSGGGAIRVDLHGKYNEISGNHIAHIGGTGILLCGYGPGTKDVNTHNLVSNNRIHHVGEIYAHSPGIFLWQSGENRVANNLIHNTPYSGIIISGVMEDFFRRNKSRELSQTIRWHEIENAGRKLSTEQIRPLLHTHDNLIEHNEIHHVMESLGDGNGIYIRGAGPNNIIRRNYIHHLLSPIVMQSAIRTDGGQRDTLITENLIYKCVSHGIHLKLNNRAENNIIADILPASVGGKKKPVSIYLKLREGPLTGGAIKRNIFYHRDGRAIFLSQGNNPRLPAAWAKEADTDYNIYFSKSNPEQALEALKKSQKDGVDVHSLAVDPLFVDPENGDFTFKPDSPALKLGIKPIDVLKRIGDKRVK